ncbi:MAG: glycine cleavage system protein H [Candidatus Rokubacteria bacterium]|nr:glycine cleavage system protein H [Candidatus Rokubacteria bacterium]
MAARGRRRRRLATIDKYEFPPDRWYDPREHLWLWPEAGPGEPVLRVGVDALGQEALGEVVYVELVEPGRDVRRGDGVGSIEAEKMVRPLLAPVSGALLEVNRDVLTNPRLLNRDPYGRGWLFRLQARAWRLERAALLHGDEAVAAWARAELRASR